MKASEYVFNPAERLFDILKAGLELKDMQVSQAWAKLLKCDPEDHQRLVSRFFQVGRLVDVTKRAIETVPDIDHALYLRWSKRMPDFFQFWSLSRQWNDARSILTPELMQSLEFAAELLSRKHLEQAISESDLAKLQDEIEKLLKEIESSDLPMDLRADLTERLAALLEAIAQYPYSGVGAIELPLQSAVGWLLFQRKETRDTIPAEYREKLSQIFWHCIELINAAGHLHVLAEPVKRLLSS